MKLYYYSTMVGIQGWSATLESFRQSNGLVKTAFAVRCAHIGVEPPAGYRKTGRELANDPVVRVGTGKRDRKIDNFYGLGVSILAAGMTGIGE